MRLPYIFIQNGFLLLFHILTKQESNKETVRVRAVESTCKCLVTATWEWLSECERHQLVSMDSTTER